MKKKLCGWLAIAAVGLVVSASSAIASPILPTSYDLLNGETGSFEYWDQIYSGSGSKTTSLAPLSGGLGDLTDGVIAVANWFIVEAPAGNGPYVGWQTINPLITFHFAGGSTIDSMTIYVDDSNGAGGVSTPGSAKINGGASIPLADGVTGAPLSFTFSGLNLDSSNPLTLQLFDGAGPWIFLSEVTFDTGRGTVAVPEPAMLALLGIGLAGLQFSRRKKA